ncbi:MAG: transaldolase [Actinobacteria bacterium]|nr:transaldolase [Actinomycetota bacterium]PLS83532.1 MAG: transaldolase [Actinomycetota bacterium]
MNERLQRLSEAGQSVWIDYLSRDSIKGGELEGMIESGVVGVTSNPTIFQKAIADSELYDEQLRELSEDESDPKELFLGLASQDIRDACDLMMPVFERTNRLDGYVSLEVSPDIAYDTAATYEEAKRLHAMVDRPNLMVKIPATEPGLAAIEDMIAAGKSINVTLIFSLSRYKAVANAYVRGLQRLVAGGGDPSGVASVASFFVSRVDSEADRRLDEIGGHDDLKGRLAIANAKLAYAAFEEIFSGEDWDFLQSKGATKQRPLWASTSTKNPDYKDTIYVDNLVGPDTVNTLPASTLEAVMDHGEVNPNALKEGVDEARKLIDELREVGVDYRSVVEVLEQEGVQKFADSFDELLEVIGNKSRQVKSQSAGQPVSS